MALSSTLAKRLFFGTLMTVALAGLLLGEGYVASRLHGVWRHGLIFAILVAAFAVAGCVELRRLAAAKGFNPSLAIMIIGVVASTILLVWATELPIVLLLVAPAIILLITLLAGALVQAAKYGNEGTLGNLAVQCFALVYLGSGCSLIVAIRVALGDGDDAWGQSGAVLMFLACVKSADIGAYLIGSQIGRHPWVPSISPKKTWEGFIGGVVLAVVVGWLFAAFSDIMSVGMGIVFGVVVAVAGQLGDLLESMLKRDAGSKDSAKLVPEFGGALDLLDSVIVAAPFALVILLLG